MIAAISNSIKDFINMEWLTGPFLDKELRVSSRHRRNYLLRSVYVIALLFFVVITWVSVVDIDKNITFQRSRLAEAGRTITATIVWFQFIATQLVAVIIFCNSISDEIYHRTLGALLTTPVTSFQIVMGKLLSKLFQIILLISISLPLLAIIRIFGGVSWSYILISLSITLTVVIFAGSLSLFFSVIFKRSYVVIILTMSVLGFLYGLRNLGFIRFSRGISYNGYGYRELSFSPFFIFERITNYIRSSGQIVSNHELIFYCSLLLLISLFLLQRSSHMLRKIALANAFGQKSFWKRFLRWIDIMCNKLFASGKSDSDRKIRRVWGPAIAWKEMKMKFSSREKMFVALIIGMELIILVAMYLFPYFVGGMGFRKANTMYINIFMLLAVLTTAIFSSFCITSEKEAGTWCLLLLTPLSDWQIMSGKLVGILRRSLPAWIILFIYFCPFLYFSGPGLVSLFFLIILIISMIVFLYGAGLYFSSRFQNTSTALMAFFILLLLIWFIIPFISSIYIPGSYIRNIGIISTFIRSYVNINPFTIANVIMISNFYSLNSFIRWPDHSRGIYESFILMICIADVYIIIGRIFAWRAKCLFRKNI